MSAEIRIPFNALPLDLRQRLSMVFEGMAKPEALVADKPSIAWAVVGWLTLALCGVGLDAVAAWWGFGDLWDDGGVQGPFLVPIWAGGAFLAVWSCIKLAQRVLQAQKLPWTPGRFLLPLDFVDATTDVLRILPRRALVDVGGTHHYTNGAYTHTELRFTFEGGTVERFSVKGQALAERVLASLRESAARIQQAVEKNDIETLVALDPFMELRLGDKWSEYTTAPATPPKDGGPVAGGVPGVFKLHLPIAIAAGFLIGVPAQLVRNYLSDAEMFAQLQQTSETWEADEYLDHGWLHKDEVETEIRPGIAFRAAQQTHTVAAMREFLQQYPDNAKYSPQAHAAIHAFYVESLAKYQAQATDPSTVPFMQTLLDWLEKHDSPTVKVRFYPPSSEVLGLVDKIIAGGDNGLIDGRPVAPVAPHFGDEQSLPREAAIVTTLQQGFGRVFPNDVLQLEAGPRLTEDELSGAITEPVLEVSYSLGASGEVYESDTTTRLFVGIDVLFDVSMKVPDSDRVISFELDVQPPEHFTVDDYSSNFAAILGNTPGGGDLSDASVYDVMALRAFDQLATKIEGQFFQAPPEPTDGGVAGGVLGTGTGTGDAADPFAGMTDEQIDAALKALEAQYAADAAAAGGN